MFVPFVCHCDQSQLHTEIVFPLWCRKTWVACTQVPLTPLGWTESLTQHTFQHKPLLSGIESLAVADVLTVCIITVLSVSKCYSSVINNAVAAITTQTLILFPVDPLFSMHSAVSNHAVNDRSVVHIVLTLNFLFLSCCCVPPVVISLLPPHPSHFFSLSSSRFSDFRSLPVSVCDFSGPLYFQMLHLEAEHF